MEHPGDELQRLSFHTENGCPWLVPCLSHVSAARTLRQHQPSQLLANASLTVTPSHPEQLHTQTSTWKTTGKQNSFVCTSDPSDPWPHTHRLPPPPPLSCQAVGTDRLKGLSLGARLVAQLVLCIMDLAGSQAIASQVLILHITDEQEEELVRSLWDYNFFG